MNIEKTYSIQEVSQGIAWAIRDAFPEEFWVVGEIQGLDRSKHGKHWYFQLCETEGDGEVYRLSATLWNRTRSRLFGAKGKLRGIIDPDEALDGIKIRALCKMDFYAPYGKISLHVQDIDPAYTLGDLEAKRQALIEKLTGLGILHKNRELVLEEVPLRIGLITSEGSAAYNDFMNEVDESGIGFHIYLCDARMQGEETAGTVTAAFAALQALDPDAIVVIRGGGSRLDLSWFDREEVVMNIVDCACPVITGIGHEIDITVCEMAAHSGLKTPTAAAVFLTEKVRDYLGEVEETAAAVAKAALQVAAQEEMELKQCGLRLEAQARLSLAEAERLIQEAPRRLASAALLRLERESSGLAAAPAGIAAGKFLRRFEALGLELAKARLRLEHGWLRRRDREGQHLALLTERCRLLDPVQTVMRGYALLRDKNGKAVKSVESLALNDRFFATLRDGIIEAGVEGIKKEDAHGRKEKRQLEIW
ncbi:MAG: exodeoxyribonuclease VII large subunit [Planctomycetota bacterium]